MNYLSWDDDCGNTANYLVSGSWYSMSLECSVSEPSPTAFTSVHKWSFQTSESITDFPREVLNTQREGRYRILQAMASKERKWIFSMRPHYFCLEASPRQSNNPQVQQKGCFPETNACSLLESHNYCPFHCLSPCTPYQSNRQQPSLLVYLYSFICSYNR